VDLAVEGARFWLFALSSFDYREAMNGHRNLVVWSLAGELIGAVYVLTESLPPEELYVATRQIRRAAWSVQNNIAEGKVRYGRTEMRRFLRISIGSLAEVDSMVATHQQLYELDPEVVAEINGHRRMINAGLFKLMHGPGRS